MTLTNPLTALHRFGALWANSVDNSNELLFSPDDIAEYVNTRNGFANVKDIGLKGDGTTESATVIAAAMLASKRLYFPTGTYLFPDGTSALLANQHNIIGDGHGNTIISTKNAYAFAAPSSGPLIDVYLSGFSTTLRAGSTSGGAVSFNSDSYHAGVFLQDVWGTSVTTSADPVFYLSGWINSHAFYCQAQSAQVGFLLGGGGFVSNASTLEICRADLCTDKGIFLDGGGLNRVINCDVEANTGWGVYVDACVGAIISGTWFEANNGHVALVNAASFSKVRDNKFHYHQAGSTRAHVALAGATTPAAMYGPQVENNAFVDLSGSGFDVSLNATVAGAKLSENRWFSGLTPVSDSGTGTQFLNNIAQDTITPTPNRVSGYWEAAYDPYYDVQRPTMPLRRRAGQTTDFVQGQHEDAATTLWLITKDGDGRFNKLGVANSAAGTVLGAVVKKVEVFDLNGTSLGFVPVYNTIT